MMKKVIWIIIAVILIGAIVTGVELFFRNRSDDIDESVDSYNEIYYNIDEVLPILRSNTLKEVQNSAAEAGIALSLYNDGLYEGFDNVLVEDVIVTALFEQRENILTGTSVQIEFGQKFDGEPEEIAEKAQECLYRAREICSAFFDVDLADKLYLYHIEGYLLEDEVASYQALAASNAVFQLLIREADNSFWTIRGFVADNQFFLYMDRYLNSSIYDAVTEDFTLTDY